MSLIHTPEGTFRERVLSQETARLLRRYKQVLVRRSLKEKLWCQHCAERGQHEGVRAVVTDGSIEIRCRCTRRTYMGQSY